MGEWREMLAPLTHLGETALGKGKIAEAKASLCELESEDGGDRAQLEYGEYQLDKLVSDMKARKKIMREKEDDLKRKQKAIDQFQLAFTC